LNFLAATLGQVVPKYRTLSQWAQTYRKIVDSKPISDKTKINRRNSLAHILADLGECIIGSILPHEIAAFINKVYAARPQTAKRLYRKQGLNTMTLLGHKHQKMTDLYNDDRGLTRGEWKVLAL